MLKKRKHKDRQGGRNDEADDAEGEDSGEKKKRKRMSLYGI